LGSIRASELCQRVGISQAKHTQWATKGLCRPIPRDGAERADAVELVVAARLMEVIRDIEKVRRAMAELGARELTPHAALAVIWDEELEFASWAGSDRDIGAKTRHGRPVRVIPVGGKLLEVLSSLERLLEERRKHG
jgi:hypothetical protein